MFRIFIIFLFAYIGFKIFKKIFSKDRTEEFKYDNKRINGEEIIPCEECKVYIPESKAIKADGKFFCSKECRDKYFKKQ